jgi:competence protein ComEA
VELNRAPLPDLLALPGVGPLGARRILQARRRRPFRALADLAAAGLGARRRERLRGHVSFDAPARLPGPPGRARSGMPAAPPVSTAGPR